MNLNDVWAYFWESLGWGVLAYLGGLALAALCYLPALLEKEERVKKVGRELFYPGMKWLFPILFLSILTAGGVPAIILASIPDINPINPVLGVAIKTGPGIVIGFICFKLLFKAEEGPVQR